MIRQDCPYHGEGDPEGSNAISSVPDNPALPPVVIIAGPTASGKSALALELAELFGGTIINADALQIYRDLPILTARPEAAAMARVPHRLYGWLDAAERGSAGRWREAGARRDRRVASRRAACRSWSAAPGCICGRCSEGLAAIPAIPPEVRDEAAGLYRALGGEAVSRSSWRGSIRKRRRGCRRRPAAADPRLRGGARDRHPDRRVAAAAGRTRRRIGSRRSC